MRKWIIQPLIISLAIISVFYLAYELSFSEPEPVYSHASGLNVIILSIETLRADHLGIYGYSRDTTPNIDRFFKDSFIFENTITPTPKTNPSLAAMLTGLYPPRHRIFDLVTPLRNITTLPGILSENGYLTGAFVSNSVLKPETSGFDKFYHHYDCNLTNPELNRKDHYERNAKDTNDAVILWLEKNSRHNFHLWVHYMDPHGPYHPPEGYRDFFSHDEPEWVPLKKIPTYQILDDISVAGNMTDRQSYIDRYDDEIRYLDIHLLDIFNKFEELGLLDNSIIIFTADHGESLGQHDYFFEHGGEAYDDSARIPLLIYLPPKLGLEGRRVDALISIKDIFPTVIDLLGIEAAELDAIDGKSMTKLFTEDASIRDVVYIDRFVPPDYVRLAVRTKDDKLIYRQGHTLECYDLLMDPHELNTNGCDNETFTQLEPKLSKRLNTPYVREGWEEDAKLSEQTIENLKSLGYL
jgi:arylsulfatase